METATYKVSGMSCDGCVSSVKKAIEREFGEVEVSIDLESGNVELPGNVDVDRLRTAITNAGFDLETN